ncbi:MAG: ABC transporter permease [Chloroflexi bacterium]|nr:ABC transporter permease [Chloroflexota bacterium]
MTAEAAPMNRPRVGLLTSIKRLADRYLLMTYTSLAVIYLLLPVAVIILFSFNDPIGRRNFVWQRFSLDAWLNPLGVPGLGESVWLSLVIAFVSTLFATMIGTLMALALVRYEFRGKSLTNSLIFLPMATPEIVMGASLLTLFVSIGNPPFFPLNIVTILIAHILFNISYVVVTVRARLVGFPRHLEEAAMDLGANEWVTFWRVTFPLILPGIVAAALLAFSLSIDDFVITNFSAGQTQTFPMFIYAQARVGVPVQVYVIGSIIFLVAVISVGLTTLAGRRQSSG